jgi:2-polyprenyl-6-methoxyphenol hydroxylase-like FAD-dependent oxidoreductase
MTTLTIAIIGAGPCGLTLARLLECKGVDYVVYERDDSENSNRVGGSLDIHTETGQHALREGGLFDEFKRYARYDDTAVALADRLGNRLLQLGQDRDAPEIDRSDLRRILLDAIPKGKIKWGHALTSATVDEDNRPVLRFANGIVLSGFKLVVGADGAWSRVRQMVWSYSPVFRHSVSNY